MKNSVIYVKKSSVMIKTVQTTKKPCKVRDHCHFTGNYRSAAHSICNLKYKVPKDIPVVFHNGSIYDNHLIIKQISKDFKGSFTCIGENTKKYISFSMNMIKEILTIRKKDLKHTG